MSRHGPYRVAAVDVIVASAHGGAPAPLDETFECIYTHFIQATLDLAATKDCYCLAARRTARTITRLYEKKLRPFGLRATQFSVLALLALKGPTRLGDAAQILTLERTTLTRVVDLMERTGWLKSVPTQDGRERRLALTLAGRKKVQTAFPAWKEAQDLAVRTPWRFPSNHTADITEDRR